MKLKLLFSGQAAISAENVSIRCSSVEIKGHSGNFLAFGSDNGANGARSPISGSQNNVYEQFVPQSKPPGARPKMPPPNPPKKSAIDSSKQKTRESEIDDSALCISNPSFEGDVQLPTKAPSKKKNLSAKAIGNFHM